MFVDSHCHLSDPSLAVQIDQVLHQMHNAQVFRALCISTTLSDFSNVLALVNQYSGLWASVGVHPEECEEPQPTRLELVNRARHKKVVAIGETGLDYFQFGDCTPRQMQWQHERLGIHIEAARETGLPLVIHTRGAAHDTLAKLREVVNAPGGVTGVFHCFTESVEVARQVLDLGFFISFSGILTFKNAAKLRDVARIIPRDACLIETDSPYLAPVPHRGKVNMPAYVPYVAKTLADLWNADIEVVAQHTSQNFDRLFSKTGSA